ncbi:hypothetical protein [Plantactinospora sp. BB1]|uniref:hypothetical protein n=1 Tax=Plantactinospora sp. BB1 TaxID=2071627 RepID=UPI00131EF110|nr:hypothetical protein [Plantactinospora sp. BB1]
MDFAAVVAWAESFAEDETAPLGLRLFCTVLLGTEAVKAFIAERDAQLGENCERCR